MKDLQFLVLLQPSDQKEYAALIEKYKLFILIVQL